MNRIDIYDRIYTFIVQVVFLVNKLPRTPSNMVIVGQILRSSTSMGANGQEADGTLTKKDFIHCFTLIRKEGKETNFWLSLIADTNSVDIKKQADILLKEGKEIVAIVSTIINKSRKT